MSQLTTHILDTTLGKPAKGVTIILYRDLMDQWEEMARGVTNADGRIPDLLPKHQLLEHGSYKLRFLTGSYFNSQDIHSFYPYVDVVFEITSGEHYHIPLLLNPYGYSTYRGS
jgi:5-hydroxyisourate hydrolase